MKNNISLFQFSETIAVQLLLLLMLFLEFAVGSSSDSFCAGFLPGNI